MIPDLSNDYREFIELLNSHKVEYLIVGAWALALHGQPRYTGDLDIFILNAPKNASKLFDALKEFGFGSVGLREEDFVVPNRVIQLGYEPNRVDILTTIRGVTFGESWQRREVVELRNLVLPFICVTDLIKNERSTGRPRDLADIEDLEKFLQGKCES